MRICGLLAVDIDTGMLLIIITELVFEPFSSKHQKQRSDKFENCTCKCSSSKSAIVSTTQEVPGKNASKATVNLKACPARNELHAMNHNIQK